MPPVRPTTGTHGEDLSSLLHLLYKNLADNSVSAAAPTQPGTFEVLASFDGNLAYNAVATFDSGKQIVIGPQSVLQSVLTGKLPTISLVAGQKIKPIGLKVKLANSSANVASGLVTVNVTLSTSPTGSANDPIVGTITKKAKIKGHKTGSFGAVKVRNTSRRAHGHVVL